MSPRIGIDLGGTKIEGILIDATGRELRRFRRPTPPHYAGTLDAIAEVVDQLAAPATTPVGVGIPGTLSAETGLVKNANSTWLIGRPLDQDLAAHLGRPVRLANDANCFALSEATDGAAAGAPVVFGVILGTGCGGGIVVDGALLPGTNGIGGEWGHNPLPWPDDEERPGPSCYCGKHGCLETWLSGPGLARDHHARTGEAVDGRILGSRTDSAATSTLERHGGRLARGLASVINVLDPDVIVLGGGVSNLPGLTARVSAALPRWVFSDTVRTRVVRHHHGDSSGVRGAAWLWPPSGA